MMKHLLHPSSSCTDIPLLRAIRVLLYPSPRTLTSSSSAASISEDTLYSRIRAVGSDPNISVIPILDGWVIQGREIEKDELQEFLRKLRKARRFKHCLEISEWMSGTRHLDQSPGHAAIQLDLIAKVHGMDQAEVYLYSIPEDLRNFQVYGALLNCYAQDKLLEKAECIMQKMRELGYARTLSYNCMLTLYSNTRNIEKFDSLVQEMEETGITSDKFTNSIRLNAYAAVSDMGRMEKFLMKMEADPEVIMDWHAYAAAASGYLKAGDTEKSFSTLKKSEQLIRFKMRRIAYEVLITMYAKLGKKEDVYRIWNLSKKNLNFSNLSYLNMISSLAILDDLDGAEKMLQEWEAEKISFDIRLPNFLISAYCKKGLLGKAESIVNRLTESGNEPNASTWSRMALGYHEANQMEKAVGAMKKAALASYPGWKPHLPTLFSCLEYLKINGDVHVAEEIIRSLEKNAGFSTRGQEQHKGVTLVKQT